MPHEFIGRFETQEDRDNEIEVYSANQQVNIDVDGYEESISLYMSLDETRKLIAYLERAIKVVIHNNLEKP